MYCMYYRWSTVVDENDSDTAFEVWTIRTYSTYSVLSTSTEYSSTRVLSMYRMFTRVLQYCQYGVQRTRVLGVCYSTVGVQVTVSSSTGGAHQSCCWPAETKFPFRWWSSCQQSAAFSGERFIATTTAQQSNHLAGDTSTGQTQYRHTESQYNVPFKHKVERKSIVQY
jgi:hypothetical protein